MPSICCVSYCKSKSGENVVLFSVPLDISPEWTSVINREDFKPSKHTKICSLHFTQECIFGKRLLAGAVPTIPFNLRGLTGTSLKLKQWQLFPETHFLLSILSKKSRDGAGRMNRLTSTNRIKSTQHPSNSTYPSQFLT